MSFQAINRKTKPRTDHADIYDVPASSPPPSTKRKRIIDGLQSEKKSKKKQRSTEAEHGPTDSNDAPAPYSSPAGSERSGRRLSNGQRGPRIGRHDATVGFFTSEEVQIIEKFKVDFCNQHGLASPKDFDRLVQHSVRGSDRQWPLPGECTKKEFWDKVYELIPNRDNRSMYRFMRRHFQDSGQKAHDWTAEQDEELIDLMARMSGKYAEIAALLGRSDDDVVQRWKNKLLHRNRMNTGYWTERELTDLLDGVERTFAAYKEHNPNSECKDFYDIPDGKVAWSLLSDSMDNARTRQQCADKWRKIRNKVQDARAGGNPDAVFDIAAEVTKSARKSERRKYPKSSYLVEEEEDDDDDNNDVVEPELRNGTENESQHKPRSTTFGNTRASTPPTSVEHNNLIPESPEDSKQAVFEAIRDAVPPSPVMTQDLDEEAEQEEPADVKPPHPTGSEIAPSSPIRSQDPESKSKAERKAEKEERRKKKAERRAKRQSESEPNSSQVPQLDTPSKKPKDSSRGQSSKKKKSKLFPW